MIDIRLTDKCLAETVALCKGWFEFSYLLACQPRSRKHLARHEQKD
ncbi:hypothetical protein [Pedosphaera parvula]|nr:hypothetical protein [Pedosphaera parvula]